MRGNEYKHLVGRYLVRTYAHRGIEVFEEVQLGTSILGKQRRVDLLILSRALGRAMALECKYQDSSGTADEKIPYALQDLASMPMPGVIVYAGSGFSEGVLHLLKSSASAAYCLPTHADPGADGANTSSPPATPASAPVLAGPLPRRSGDPVDSGTWQLDHALALNFGWWDLLVADKKPLTGE